MLTDDGRDKSTAARPGSVTAVSLLVCAVACAVCAIGSAATSFAEGSYAFALFSLAIAVGSYPLVIAAWSGLRIARAAEATREHLAEIRRSLRDRPAAASPGKRFDLADAARDAGVLISATLLTARFPRLAGTVPQAEPDSLPGATNWPGIGIDAIHFAGGEDAARFEAAVTAGQLRAARTIGAVIRLRVGPRRSAVIDHRLDTLAQATARKLRARFGNLIRAKHFEEAMEIGEEIAELFPGTVIERDYTSLRPVLEQRSRELPPPTGVLRIAR